MSIKVIKTNLSIANDRIIDHQSYVETEESWDAFIEKVKSGHLFSKHHKVRVERIVYDNFHLSCDVYSEIGKHAKHLAMIQGYVKLD